MSLVFQPPADFCEVSYRPSKTYYHRTIESHFICIGEFRPLFLGYILMRRELAWSAQSVKAELYRPRRTDEFYLKRQACTFVGRRYDVSEFFCSHQKWPKAVCLVDQRISGIR